MKSLCLVDVLVHAFTDSKLLEVKALASRSGLFNSEGRGLCTQLLGCHFWFFGEDSSLLNLLRIEPRFLRHPACSCVTYRLNISGFSMACPIPNFFNTVQLHLSGLIGMDSQPDTQKIRIIGFFWRCMHRASSYNMYKNQQDAHNSCD